MKKGEIISVVGESGCGKSTFVRMVISLDKPTSGEILYHGKNLADLSQKEIWLNRQNMQMVFQDPLFCPSDRCYVSGKYRRDYSR